MASIDKQVVFEGMARTLPVLAFVVDAQGVFREVIANDYTNDLLYEEPSATIGKSIHDLFANEQAETFAEHIDQALKAGAVQKFEYSLPIEGKTRTFVGYIAPLDVDLEEEHVIWVAEDITERIELRKERQRQHDHLVTVERLAQVGGWEYIPDTETIEWTDGTKRIFEVPDDFEPTFSDAINFYHEADQPIIGEAVEQCLEAGVQFSLDAQVITDKGRQRWVLARGDRSTEDGVKKVSGVIQDITRRKTREQRLRVLDRVLRHNLRNELNQIQGYAEMIEEQLTTEGQRFYSKIMESSDRLLSLAEKSKQFDTALENNYVIGVVSLVPLLNDLCAEYREKYPAATIETELDDAYAPGNEMAIQLIFEELIQNALKHNDATHPRVKVILANRGPNRATISVVDNGPGLNEMEQAVINGGEETSLRHSLGIGLWTTSWLVSELSGDMQVTAKVGEGTTITIMLPADDSL